jgi:molybdopterin molybdotransferase
MLSVAEALETVLRHAGPLPPVEVALGPTALGLALAEAVVSDIDSPPHDKSMMDGYAVRCADLAGGSAVVEITEEITAGRTPQREVGPGQAARIMTGAPIPTGADAVVMVERSRPLDGGRVSLDDRPRPGHNILPRGRELRRGEAVLPSGHPLRPQELGLLATVGRTTVRAYPAPVVSVLATGDELVPAERMPGPGQIRNSNGPMLLAQVARAGGSGRDRGIVPDRTDDLRERIGAALSDPVVLLAGGVSMGTLDLVPGVLSDLGVEPHFHKVRLKPGKPLFFGTRGGTLVFGLPGNPVSSFVGFELFVRPALRRLRGLSDAGPRVVPVPLAEEFAADNDRPTYHPARLEVGPDGWRVRPVPWFGSPDLKALTQADALLVLPAGAQRYEEGQSVPVLLINGRSSDPRRS